MSQRARQWMTGGRCQDLAERYDGHESETANDRRARDVRTLMSARWCWRARQRMAGRLS